MNSPLQSLAFAVAIASSSIELRAADLPQNPFSDGLFAFYRFEGTAEDQSGNGNHGTLGGTRSFSANGLQGQALRITGDGSIFYAGGGHMLLPSLPATANSGFSVSLWVKDDVRGVDNEAYVALGDESSASMNIMLRSERDHPLMFSGSNGSGGGFQIAPLLDEAEYFQPNRWKHLVLTYGAGVIRAYLDGKPMGEATAVFELFPVSVAAVGRHWWNGGSSSSARMSATVDNLRLYQRTLSAAEVEALYVFDATPSSGFITNGLVGYYPFSDSTQDESGKGAHGTFQGPGHEFVSGVQGKAVKMVGDTRISGTGIQVANSSHTISFWYRRNFTPRPSLPVYGGGFGLGSGSQDVAGTRLHIGFDYADKLLRYSFWYDDFDVMDTPLGETGWEHVAFTFDKAALQRAIYRNGVRIATQAAAYGFSGNSDFAIIGGDALRPAAFDEFRVYNRALSNLEVGALFRTELPTANPDQDRDGLPDDDETFTYNTSPTDADTDDDGLNDGDEVKTYRTNPLKADSDGDGYTDSTEVFAGKDPRDANSHPAATLSVFPAIELEFFTQTDKQYLIESSGDLSSWSPFEGPIPGDGKVWKKTFSARETETRFYRVVLAP